MPIRDEMQLEQPYPVACRGVFDCVNILPAEADAVLAAWHVLES